MVEQYNSNTLYCTLTCPWICWASHSRLAPVLRGSHSSEFVVAMSNYFIMLFKSGRFPLHFPRIGKWRRPCHNSGSYSADLGGRSWLPNPGSPCEFCGRFDRFFSSHCCSYNGLSSRRKDGEAIRGLSCKTVPTPKNKLGICLLQNYLSTTCPDIASSRFMQNMQTRENSVY